MYVIFPADEVVYLSYDRVLLIPATNSVSNDQASPSTPSQSTGSHTSHPSTSNSSTRSKQSAASAPAYNGYAENPTKKPIAKSKSFKVTTSTPEQPPVRPRRTKKEQKQKTSLEKPPSFLQLPSRSKSKTPERRLSFSDYLSQSRERTPNCSASGGKSKSPSPSGPSPGEGYFRTNKRVCCLGRYFRY